MVEQVKLACAHLGAVSAAFRAAVAAERGLSAVEEQAISLIERAGRITAGILAIRLRLAPSSVTALLYRLQHKKLIRRVRSLRDGRSYPVELDPDCQFGLRTRFDDFTRTLDELLARYSDEQLGTILDFARELARLQQGALTMAAR
jgi:DNA-binding MarR family transcriptional regulator